MILVIGFHFHNCYDLHQVEYLKACMEMSSVMRMRYFPSKSWEFVFLSAYLSVNVNLDLRYMPQKSFLLVAFRAQDACCDQFRYHKRAISTEE